MSRHPFWFKLHPLLFILFILLLLIVYFLGVPFAACSACQLSLNEFQDVLGLVSWIRFGLLLFLTGEHFFIFWEAVFDCYSWYSFIPLNKCLEFDNKKNLILLNVELLLLINHKMKITHDVSLFALAIGEPRSILFSI